MASRVIRIIAIVISVLTILSIQVYCMEYDKNSLIIDDKNYTSLGDESYTFGTNVWHTRYIDNNIVLPIKELWKTEPMDIKPGSNSSGQPLILEDVIIACSGDYIYVIDRKTGMFIPQSEEMGIRLQRENSINKSIYSSPLYLSNRSGWFNKDGLSRVFIGTRTEGIMHCYKITRENKLINEWSYKTRIKNDRSGGIVSSPTLIFDEVEGDGVYIAFGNEEGYLYILDARDGRPVQGGEIYVGGKLSSSPIGYASAEGVFSNIAIGVNDGGTGFIYGGYVRGYTFYEDESYNRSHYSSTIGSYGIPSSLSVGRLDGNGLFFIYSDKRGNIYCLRQHNNKSELLFKIDRYDGMQSLNTPTIVDNRYGIFTLNHRGKCKLVCIDIKSAIKEAQGGTARMANNSIYWESEIKDSGGPAYIGATSISTVINGERRLIAIAGDEGLSKNKPNLRAYYIEQRIGNSPILIRDGFLDSDSSDGLYQEYGVKSEPAFADDIFVVMDGRGVLHAYSIKPRDNNIRISIPTKARGVRRGETFDINLDISSSFNIKLEKVVLEVYCYDELIYSDRVDIPAHGLKVTVPYKIAQNFALDTLELRAEINMNDRVVEENNYSDNIATSSIPILEANDLEVISIEDTTFYPGIASPIRVVVANNSDIGFKDIGIKLEIDNSMALEKTINLGPREKGTISFRIDTPSSNTDFILRAEINHSRAIKEYDYTNNYKKANCIVKYTPPPPQCEEKVIWTEKRFSHYKTVTRIYYDSNGNKRTRSKKVPVFKDVSFYALIDLKGSVTPKAIKSGYGVELNINTTIKHNYDKPKSIVGIQRVLAYFPDMDEPIELEPTKVKGALKNTWVLPINKNSVLNKRNHYIPTNWPDGPYKITIKAFESSTPGGKPCLKMALVVDVDGHMYLDDVTS